MYTSNRQAAKAGAQKIHSAAELRVMYSPCLRCSPHHDLLSRTYLVHFPFAPSISHSAVGDGRSGWYLAVSPVGRMLLTRVHRSVCHALTHSTDRLIPQAIPAWEQLEYVYMGGEYVRFKR